MPVEIQITKDDRRMFSDKLIGSYFPERPATYFFRAKRRHHETAGYEAVLTVDDFGAAVLTVTFKHDDGTVFVRGLGYCPLRALVPGKVQ